MQEIDLELILERRFDVEDLMEWLSGETKVLLWGAHNYGGYKDHVLRFQVNANHKGYVYITGSDASDEYNVYITTLEDMIIDKFERVNELDLINTIDKRI